MEAIIKSHGEIAIISIQGTLDIQQTQPLREICLRHFKDKKVIFNMERANFVGSTGIQPFLETVKSLAILGKFVKIVGVKSEFRRIIQNMELQSLEFHETEFTAIESFHKPTVIDPSLLVVD